MAHAFLITSFYCLDTHSDHVLYSVFSTSWCLSLHKLSMHRIFSFSRTSASLRLLFPSSWLSYIFSALLLIDFRSPYPPHSPCRQLLLLQQCQQLLCPASARQ